MRARTVGLWGALAACFAACGGTVAVEQAAATTGAGGSGTSASSSAASTSASSSAASSTATGSGGAGGSVACGGFAGLSCPAGEYCSFTDKECGGNDSGGVCTPVPTDCDTIAAPVCGCDQKAYVNGCYANMAGTDIDALGGCTPPMGMFGCGFNFCEIGRASCRERV